MKYVGFNPALEEAHKDPDNDWKFGAASVAALYPIPLAQRAAYLPKGEVQRGIEDTQDCASRAPNNMLETQFSFADKTGLMKPENRQWGRDNGYADSQGNWTFSDRFVAILSGTTRQGNSLKAPLEAIRTQGLIPKSMLPLAKTMAFEQYIDPASVTKAMRDLGQEFKKRFTINYEQVGIAAFELALTDSMLDVALFAWPFSINGEYPRDPRPANHAVCMFATPMANIFDNYEESPGDFIKKLAKDYLYYDYGYRLFVSSEQLPAAAAPDLLTLAFDWVAKVLTWMRGGKVGPLPTPPQEIVTPAPVPVPPSPPHLSRISAWALAIQHNEGGKPSDINIRLHNPGNLKYTAYTASLGGKKSTMPGLDGGTFCMFDTYDAGFKALCKFLTDGANNLLMSYKQARTLKQFTMTYANIPSTHPYIKNVAKELGVSADIPINQLL